MGKFGGSTHYRSFQDMRKDFAEKTQRPEGLRSECHQSTARPGLRGERGMAGDGEVGLSRPQCQAREGKECWFCRCLVGFFLV
jgi:hypothetical protein